MLDGKILAAVLATLAAIAVSTSGGDFQDIQLGMNQGSDFTMPSVSRNPIQILKRAVLPVPEPENDIDATIYMNDIGDTSLRIREASLRLSNTSRLDMADGPIISDEALVFYGFRGSVKPSNQTSINGRASGIYTSGVNISQAQNLKLETEISAIDIEGARSDSMKFKNSRADISSGGTTTSLENGTRTVSLSGYSGNIRIFPGNDTVYLEGRVGRLEAGSFSFGD